MIEIMKKVARDTINNERPVKLIEAVVDSPPPNLSIRLKNDPKLTIPKELLVVSEVLTNHIRTVRINGGETTQIEFTEGLKVGDRVMVIAYQGGQKFYINDRLKRY